MRVRILATLFNPLVPSFITAKMPATPQRDSLQKLRAQLFFHELNFFIVILFGIQKRTRKPRTSTCYTASTTATAPTTKREKKASKPLGHALDSLKRRKSILQQTFDLIEECIHHCIKKEVTYFRKPLQVGLKLAITLRHLATGETYKSNHLM